MNHFVNQREDEGHISVLEAYRT